MDEATTTPETLSDEDIRTISSGVGSAETERPGDQDGTDTKDQDGTDTKDQDGTDTQDAGGTDMKDSDGTDQAS